MEGLGEDPMLGQVGRKLKGGYVTGRGWLKLATQPQRRSRHSVTQDTSRENESKHV